MTIKPPASKRQLRMIEFGLDQIRVSYSDGSLEIDNNPREENGSHSVDIFIKPNELGDGDKFIVTQERFRPEASIWGPVRERLASEEERTRAQRSFGFAEARANILFRDFVEAVNDQKISLRRSAPGEPFQLFYRDPRDGIERVFRLYSNPDAAPEDLGRVTSLSLDGRDGVRVTVSSAERLASIQDRLDLLFRKLQQANGKR